MPHNKPMATCTYRKEKLQMLEDFDIEITSEIENEMNKREREIDIDHYCHDLIKKRLNCD